ncbi:helix-turn-helix domain-containing protein [uncultured Clostridium sp.]|uniref:helix-turn-helix domain-containing protein n=1 Tax=uncultured Clostridium sp. TaxID=59620 RepID=UPI0025EB032C|nr:helix-turn-helix domain-containing protein [uncultured Clostridium sp.]
MIEKSPFEIKSALDEQIHFESKDGVQYAKWTKDNKPITLRNFINRMIDNKDIFPMIAELKDKYDKLLLEHEELKDKDKTLQTDYRELLLKYEKINNHNDELIKEVIRLREKLEPFEKNQGKGRRKGTYKLKSEQIQQVLKLYEEGISKRQIAFKFKVDEKTIRNIIKRESE